MKTIFTLTAAIALTFLTRNKAISQNCGTPYTAVAFPTAITMDGNMSDWTVYLNQLGNNVYDNTAGIDLDAPISDAGRDLVRFAFTEDAQHLYIFLERAGSTANAVDILFYVDVNNNDIMELKEPVYHINWSGANGNVSVSVKDYNPSLLGVLLNTLSLNLDGLKLMGTLSNRGNSGPGSSSGKGSADGKSVEIMIPFTQLTTQNSSGNVIDQLSFGENFKFHVSTINGNITSVPGLNSINDNFGGCLNVPTVITATLPVKLTSFTATLTNNNKADLKWVTASEINVSHFVIERSLDGINFSEAAMLFAYGNATDKTSYSYSDNLSATTSSVVYYRLRSVDIDGKVQYSEVRIIRIGKDRENSLSILTYPNPVQNELRITIPAAWQNKMVTYEIFNSTGQVVRKILAASSSQTETINMNTMARGFYMVKSFCGAESAQQRIVKQ